MHFTFFGGKNRREDFYALDDASVTRLLSRFSIVSAATNSAKRGIFTIQSGGEGTFPPALLLAPPALR